MSKNGSWEENRKLICDSLKRHEQKQELILTEITNIKIEVTKLQMKAGVWGFLAGLLPVLIAILIGIVKNIL